MTADLDADLALMTKAAEKAGRMALKAFRSDPSWRKKAGGEPVSETDLAIDRFLKKSLIGARPHYGWLSEETADNAARLAKSHVFVVDPIDGTRAFLNGTTDFAVSIGLVVDGVPVAGVLDAPAAGERYAARSGGGATLNGAPVNANTPAAGAQPALYASSGTAKRCGGTATPVPNSTALRVAHAAAGRIDGVVILAGRAEWDVAAADVILREAGGRMADKLGKPWVYNGRRPHRDGVIAGAPALCETVMARLSSGARP